MVNSMFSNFNKLKIIKEAALAAFQKGHLDFDQQTYEGLKQRFPEAADQIKNLCVQALKSCKECEDIEHKVEELQEMINSNPEAASELNEFAQGLEDEYYQHLKEMDWVILFDIHKDGSTTVKPLDILSSDDSNGNSDDILSEYIFHPIYTDWLRNDIEQKTASVDMSWMNEVNKVTKPGVNVETPYGKVFVHPKKGRRYIKKKDGVIESLPRFLLSLNGINLPKGQDIHHKDENKLNDSVDNYDYSEHHDHARDHLNFKKTKAAEAYTTFDSVESLIKQSSSELGAVPTAPFCESDPICITDRFTYLEEIDRDEQKIVGDVEYYKYHNDIEQMIKANTIIK